MPATDVDEATQIRKDGTDVRLVSGNHAQGNEAVGFRPDKLYGEALRLVNEHRKDRRVHGGIVCLELGHLHAAPAGYFHGESPAVKVIGSPAAGHKGFTNKVPHINELRQSAPLLMSVR